VLFQQIVINNVTNSAHCSERLLAYEDEGCNNMQIMKNVANRITHEEDVEEKEVKGNIMEEIIK
jgi:hypothetical protein